MKRLLSIAMLAAALPAPAMAAGMDQATLVRLAGSVLKIEVIRAQGGYSLGSGVVIGADRVVTNCHVTRDARQIAVLQGGLRLPVQTQRVDADHDLCVLRARGIDASRAAVLGQAATLVVGQPLTAIGHTAGMLQNSAGEVLALHRLDGGRVVQTSNYFNSGASGGGLFDADSRLVGVLTFRLRGGTAHYFAMPAEWLARQQHDAGDKEEAVAPRPPTQLAFWERPLERQPFFLRAAVLENAGSWPALQTLASDWLRRDANDPEPWYLLGLALRHQHLDREARHALECALALAPDLESARAELQRVSLRPGAAPDATVPAPPCHL